jgi:uncharacterized MnhB-related membrane protein
MTVSLVVDVGLAILALFVACWVIAVRDTFAAVIGFVVYGLLLSLLWVRLWAIDIALTEAAIGSGVTGALLLRTLSRISIVDSGRPANGSFRLVVGLFCAFISLAIAAVILALPEPGPTLAPEASAGLPAIGVGNPVTAVLLAYRAFDTFLEKVVLVLALIGGWSLTADRDWGGAPVLWRYSDPDGVLKFLAQTLPPIGVLVAVYMLWTGANHPGGAFQASAMLAAMWMLTIVGGLMRMPRMNDGRLRFTLVSGASAFLLLGFAGFGIAGSFLAYPPEYAKALIVAVEIPMTIAVAATLVMLVAGPSQRGRSS